MSRPTAWISTTLVLATLVAAGAGSARAQDLVPKAAPQSGPIWITNATIHTVSDGTVPDASMLFDAGRIVEIRPGSPGSPGGTGGAEVIDAGGAHVYPGFICPASVVGLAEVGQVTMSLDTTEAGRVKPEALAAVAVNPDSWLIPVTRRNGVLTTGAMPSGGLVSGRASVLRLDGWTWADMAIRRDAGLVIQWPFPSRGGARGRFGRGGSDERSRPRETLDELFDAAEAYLTARAADPSIPRDVRYEAMAPAIRGDRPVFVSANDVRQIEAAIEWAVERDLRPVIVGGRDAGSCVEFLVRHEVPVILNAVHRLPSRRDLPVTEPFEVPRILEEAGVIWSLTIPANAFSSTNARNLPYEAAACIAHGLDPEAALRSITLSAAQCLDLHHELGSLERGKRATFFVADGDAFELTTRITAAYVDGKRIVLRDKQVALYEKYREKYRQLGLIDGEEEELTTSPR